MRRSCLSVWEMDTCGKKVVELFVGWSVCVIWVLLCEQKVPYWYCWSPESACETCSESLRKFICMWNMVWRPEEVYVHVKHGLKDWGSLCASETWCERLRKFICKWNMLWQPEEVYLQVKHAVKSRESLSGNETHCESLSMFVWRFGHVKNKDIANTLHVLAYKWHNKSSLKNILNFGIDFGTIKIKQHYTEYEHRT